MSTISLPVEAGELRTPPAQPPAPSPFTAEEAGQHGEAEFVRLQLERYGSVGHVVDVGCHDGVTYSNSLGFRRRGWKTTLIDRDLDALDKAARAVEDGAATIPAIVGLEPGATLDELLAGAGVPEEFDLLSLDIDSYDYHVFESLKRFRPRFVIIETVDQSGPFGGETDFVPVYGEPVEKRMSPNGEPWRKLAGRRAMAKLARAKGYRVCGATRINLILIRQDVLDSQPLRLNIGAGDSLLSGFLALDADFGDCIFPLDARDGTAEEIYASHVLEHFGHRQTFAVLREWIRALKPWGRLRIAVPDFNFIQAGAKDGSLTLNLAEMYLFGGHLDDHDHHGALFTEQKLAAFMRQLGLERIQKFKSENADCSALPVSLNMEGVKRAFKIHERPVVVAVLSQPRIGFTDSMLSLHRSLRVLQMRQCELFKPMEAPMVDDIIHCGGAFWEKYLTGGIKHAMGIGADYILFADYDGVWDPPELLRIYDLMQSDPSISAAFAVQASRHHDKPLVMNTALDYATEETQVQLGHFGLTIIRAEVFETLPKPWFWSMPNPVTMEWDTEGHCDADITFWRVMAEHGHRVVQVNDVQIGHMDLCVKWLTPKGIAYQPISNYKQKGRPKDAKFDPAAFVQRMAEPKANGHL